MGEDKSRRRWLAPALFVSLALNLLVAGVFAGVVLGDGPPHRGAEKHGGDPSFPYIRALDDAQRGALRESFRRSLQEGGEDRSARRARFVGGYEAAARVLRAEPFDRAALARAMSEQAERAAARRTRGQAVLVEFLAGLTPEARAAYADRLEAEIARFGDR
ncbi:periplasmic heavy metal sensor [Roseivivax sediminis]|uniref:Uncharacterized membrane protein n=1 Tax=Roseivivax sediminis TaxID=936889 RepID=A0A1I1TBL6_9RHOB|nr:periplasmic heavy metal sensor [Roseivivax sediminis]SFD55976.1 Uncharacterized membrane protein [Roseivivax sediminis]